MNLRPDDEPVPHQATARYVVWGIVAIAIVAGVALALMYGPRITPVLEALP